jgi:hypothetical protein
MEIEIGSCVEVIASDMESIHPGPSAFPSITSSPTECRKCLRTSPLSWSLAIFTPTLYAVDDAKSTCSLERVQHVSGPLQKRIDDIETGRAESPMQWHCTVCSPGLPPHARKPTPGMNRSVRSRRQAAFAVYAPLSTRSSSAQGRTTMSHDQTNSVESAQQQEVVELMAGPDDSVPVLTSPPNVADMSSEDLPNPDCCKPWTAIENH